ncbi:MAG TPA: hypothetical protein VJV79_40845 [Polyangiaceae bacterium]|nr:hypothetical protein [Polyangiaceae bacterium]
MLTAAVMVGSALPASGAASTAASRLPIELSWEAPASCPKSSDIQRDVRQLLGDAVLPDSLPKVVALVSVRQNPDGTLQVRVRTTSGNEVRERELRLNTCDETQQVVAFLLAFLIDPRAQPQPPSEQAPPSARVVPPVPPAKVEPDPSNTARSLDRRAADARWIASVLIAAETGTLPSLGFGGELRTGVVFSNWSIEARAAAWLPRSAESSSVSGAGGEFMLLDAGVLGCLRLAQWKAQSMRMCAGPLLLSLSGSAYGVQTPGADTALLAAATAEAAFVVAVSSRTSLRLGLGAVVPFRRPTFAIREADDIHRPSAAGARVAMGVELAF